MDTQTGRELDWLGHIGAREEGREIERVVNFWGFDWFLYGFFERIRNCRLVEEYEIAEHKVWVCACV